MPVLALGVSYRRADVELLERLAFTEEEYAKAYRRLRDAEAVSEAVILSTCNRVEVYGNVATYHSGFQDLKRFLAESREVSPEYIAEPLYSHYEAQAAEHLFSVAAGIDSVVVGEPQILTQRRRAFGRAETEGATGPLMSALFRGAIRTGRRARSETSIASSPSEFVRAGVALAERAIGPLAGRPAAVVGAGPMASLAAAHLRDLGMTPIRILNRSAERAARLAERTGAEPARLEALSDVLGRADLVVSSTGAAGVVVGRGPVEAALPTRAAAAVRPGSRRAQRRRAVGGGPSGVALVDLDDLKEELRARGEASLAEVDAVRAIVAEEVGRYEAWRRAARLAPLIQALRDRGDRAVAAELARLGPKLAGLSDRERETVEALARGVAAKLLHDPIVRLREATSAGEGAARAAAELFDLHIPAADSASRTRRAPSDRDTEIAAGAGPGSGGGRPALDDRRRIRARRHGHLGDRGASGASSPAGVKGLFVAEIVRALQQGSVDIAVHSAKDLPSEDPEGIVVAAVPERADPFDVLVTRDGHISNGAVIGTSSLRRRAQLLRSRADLKVVDLRGNVDTRLRKLDEGVVDALVLAAAGLARLGVEPPSRYRFPSRRWSRRRDRERSPCRPGQPTSASSRSAGGSTTTEAGWRSRPNVVSWLISAGGVHCRWGPTPNSGRTGFDCLRSSCVPTAVTSCGPRRRRPIRRSSRPRWPGSCGRRVPRRSWRRSGDDLGGPHHHGDQAEGPDGGARAAPRGPGRDGGAGSRHRAAARGS